MNRSTIVITLIAAAVLMGWSLDCANKKMRERYAGKAFPQLQDTALEEHGVQEAAMILRTWNELDANDEIRTTMLWDLVFPFFYASALAMLALLVSAPIATRWNAVLGQTGAAAALVGGVADLAENFTMLTMLGHPENASLVSVLRVLMFLKNAGPSLAGICVVLSAGRFLWLKGRRQPLVRGDR